MSDIPEVVIKAVRAMQEQHRGQVELLQQQLRDGLAPLEEAIRILTGEKAVLEERCNAFRSAAQQKDESAAAAQRAEVRQPEEQAKSKRAKVEAEKNAWQQCPQAENDQPLSGNGVARGLRLESAEAEDTPRNNADMIASELRILLTSVVTLRNDLSAYGQRLARTEQKVQEAEKRRNGEMQREYYTTSDELQTRANMTMDHILQLRSQLSEESEGSAADVSVVLYDTSTTTGEPSQKRARTDAGAVPVGVNTSSAASVVPPTPQSDPDATYAECPSNTFVPSSLPHAVTDRVSGSLVEETRTDLRTGPTSLAIQNNSSATERK